MGEIEAFKLIRNSSSQQRLAAKKELAAKPRREMEELAQRAESRVQKKARKPRLMSGPMALEPMSRREIIAMRRRKYFAKHSARAIEDSNASCPVSGTKAVRPSRPMSGPMSVSMTSGQGNAAQRPLSSCHIRPVADFNAPLAATGPMSSDFTSDLAKAISAAEDEMEMADLERSMNQARL